VCPHVPKLGVQVEGSVGKGRGRQICHLGNTLALCVSCIELLDVHVPGKEQSTKRDFDGSAGEPVCGIQV